MRGRVRLLAEAAALLALYETWFRGVGGRLLTSLPPRQAAIAGAVTDLIFVAAIVIACNGFALRPRGVPERAVGWKRSWRPMALALLVLGASALALRLADPRYDDVEFARQGLGSSAAFTTLVAAIPFLVAAEEILFRACQERLRGAIGGAASIALIGVAFAAHHAGPEWATRHGAESLIATLGGGLILAALYETIGSVGLLIAAHLTYDALAVAQAWLNVNRMRWKEAALFGIWIGGAAAAAFAARRARGSEAPRGT